MMLLLLSALNCFVLCFYCCNNDTKFPVWGSIKYLLIVLRLMGWSSLWPQLRGGWMTAEQLGYDSKAVQGRTRRARRPSVKFAEPPAGCDVCVAVCVCVCILCVCQENLTPEGGTKWIWSPEMHCCTGKHCVTRRPAWRSSSKDGAPLSPHAVWPSQLEAPLESAVVKAGSAC